MPRLNMTVSGISPVRKAPNAALALIGPIRHTNAATALRPSRSRQKANAMPPPWTTTTARHPSTSSARTTLLAALPRTPSTCTASSSKRPRISSRSASKPPRPRASPTCTSLSAAATTAPATSRRSSRLSRSCAARRACSMPPRRTRAASTSTSRAATSPAACRRCLSSPLAMATTSSPAATSNNPSQATRPRAVLPAITNSNNNNRTTTSTKSWKRWLPSACRSSYAAAVRLCDWILFSFGSFNFFVYVSGSLGCFIVWISALLCSCSVTSWFVPIVGYEIGRPPKWHDGSIGIFPFSFST